MSVKPILFSGPMVRALLDGRKTQTRRVLKPQPDDLYEGQIPDQLRIFIGNLLWVRESIRRFDKGSCDQWAWYDAGRNDIGDHAPWVKGMPTDGPWPYPRGPAGGAPYSVPSIHMPRWASRLTLRVTGVRVQRLQDISEEDAKAEGLSWMMPTYGIPGIASTWNGDPRESYRALWNSINGPGSWEANPWVAAYTFDVIRANVDAVLSPSKAGG